MGISGGVKRTPHELQSGKHTKGEADMAREGGSYIKEKDGSLTLVQRTQPAVKKEPIKAVKPAKKSEVVTDESA